MSNVLAHLLTLLKTSFSFRGRLYVEAYVDVSTNQNSRIVTNDQSEFLNTGFSFTTSCRGGGGSKKDITMFPETKSF